MSRLARDRTTESVSRDQILRRERGQGNINFPCSANHEQDWQPYPVDPYSCYMCYHRYHTLIHTVKKNLNASSKPSEHPHIIDPEGLDAFRFSFKLNKSCFYYLYFHFNAA